MCLGRAAVRCLGANCAGGKSKAGDEQAGGGISHPTTGCIPKPSGAPVKAPDDTSQLFVYKIIDGSPVTRHNGK